MNDIILNDLLLDFVNIKEEIEMVNDNNRIKRLTSIEFVYKIHTYIGNIIVISFINDKYFWIELYYKIMMVK